MNEIEKLVSHHGQNYRNIICVEQKDWPFFYFDDDHAGTMPRKRRTRTVCSTVEHLRNCVQFSLPCSSICPSLSRLFSSSRTREKLGFQTRRQHAHTQIFPRLEQEVRINVARRANSITPSPKTSSPSNHNACFAKKASKQNEKKKKQYSK